MPMADDYRDPSDPPRKHYGLKPKEYERVNPPSLPEKSPAPSPPAPTHDTSQPIDVRDLYRHARTSGPLLAKGGKAADPNDVHAILKDNLARANEAGLNTLSPRPGRKSKRKRDYWLLMLCGNAFMAYVAAYALRSHNAVLFVYIMAGIGMFSAAVTWIMWFVMDDY